MLNLLIPLYTVYNIYAHLIPLYTVYMLPEINLKVINLIIFGIYMQ